MTTEPTLSELMLAYDRGERTDAERLFRGGYLTMQGALTQEGERALINAYRHLAIRLEARVGVLTAAGNRLVRLAAAAGTDAAPAKREWRALVKKE